MIFFLITVILEKIHFVLMGQLLSSSRRKKFCPLGKEIKVTKDNPIYDSAEYMYFSSLSEIQNKMISYRNGEGEDKDYPFYTKFKHHTTVRNCDYIEITKKQS